MNILAVDDDRFVLEALRTGMDWEKLGFQNFYTANNIGKAKKLLEEERIDLLISDIDMPGGTGLELAGWLRGRNDETTVIFLTDYADFTYAQQAVALKSFQYMLKPIDFQALEKVVQDAMQHTKKKKMMNLYRQQCYWYQALWKNAEVPEEVKEAEEWTDAPKILAMGVLYFYPYVVREHSVFSVFEDEIDEHMTLKSVWEEEFRKQGMGEILFFLRDPGHVHTYAFGVENKAGAYLEQELKRLVVKIAEQFRQPVRAVYSMGNRMEVLAEEYRRLRKLLYDFPDREDTVLSGVPFAGKAAGFDKEKLGLLLKTREFQKAKELLLDYLNNQAAFHSLNSEAIYGFQIDFLQLVYGYLQEKRIAATDLFSDRSYHILSYSAVLCVTGMKNYVVYILDALETVGEDGAKASISQEIRQYLDSHLAEDLSRADLSRIFFLNPDYITKLFKEETGDGIKNYVMKRRIENAKNLLEQTDMPVSGIADSVGYGNYSYFTRLFKKETGFTPVEYRANIKKDSP